MSICRDDTGSPDERRGRRIYHAALEDRRGFRPDQLGIDEEDEVWAEIFVALGVVARLTEGKL